MFSEGDGSRFACFRCLAHTSALRRCTNCQRHWWPLLHILQILTGHLSLSTLNLEGQEMDVKLLLNIQRKHSTFSAQRAHHAESQQVSPPAPLAQMDVFVVRVKQHVNAFLHFLFTLQPKLQLCLNCPLTTSCMRNWSVKVVQNWRRWTVMQSDSAG